MQLPDGKEVSMSQHLTAAERGIIESGLLQGNSFAYIGKNEKKLLDLLHLSPIPPDDVMLSHKLLNLRKR